MSCDCMEKANKALAPHNTRIEQVFSVMGSGLRLRWPISTKQVEKGRGKPKAMGLFASYCPLCGGSLTPPAGEGGERG